MYLDQPETYYESICRIACEAIGIPVTYAPAIINRECAREKEKKRTKYSVSGKVRCYTKYVLKYSQEIKLAKEMVYYFLWSKRIKSPTSHDMYQSRIINPIADKISDDAEFSSFYEKFRAEADKVRVHKKIQQVYEYFT